MTSNAETTDAPDHAPPKWSNESWTVAGTVSTAWAVVISVLLTFESNLRDWLQIQSAWLTPTLLLLCAVLSACLAYVAGRWRTLNNGKPSVTGSHPLALRSVGGDFGYATIEVARVRESSASIIWIVSPHLHYDIYDPQFAQTVKSNKARGAQYRYIVPQTDGLEDALKTYMDVHHEDEADIEAQFAQLPDSAFTSFLTELAIYDASGEDIYATALPPAGGGHHEDIIVFTRSLSRQYARNFSMVWRQHKGFLP